MNRIVLSLLVFLCMCPLLAQNQFLENLRQHRSGQGRVTVQQSARIESLVRGTPSSSNELFIPTGSSQANTQDLEDSITRPNLSEGVRTTGYRIQVYAGGNSREAKQAAERNAANAKQHFAHLGVYAYFTNPRWVCRIGNFKTHNETKSALEEVKTIFPEAVVIRCQIYLPKQYDTTRD